MCCSRPRSLVEHKRGSTNRNLHDGCHLRRVSDRRRRFIGTCFTSLRLLKQWLRCFRHSWAGQPPVNARTAGINWYELYRKRDGVELARDAEPHITGWQEMRMMEPERLVSACNVSRRAAKQYCTSIQACPKISE